MLAVDAAAESLKKQAESIEKEFPEGRLFDIDVIGTDGLKLSRNVPRKCLICGQPAQQNTFGGGAPKSDSGTSEKGGSAALFRTCGAGTYPRGSHNAETRTC